MDDPSAGPDNERLERYSERDFRLYEADKLKNFIDDSFIYVDYPQTSFILKILMELAGILFKFFQLFLTQLRRKALLQFFSAFYRFLQAYSRFSWEFQ